MRAITYTDLCDNLIAELDRVYNDYDVTVITRQQSNASVLMSLKEYESLLETAHLMDNSKNAQRLMSAIEDIENRRNIVYRELIEE